MSPPIFSIIYTLVAENKELFRFFYSAAITLVCLVIVLKTDRLFRISSHQGIRYFRNAFFFYGIAFILRYLIGSSYFFNLFGFEPILIGRILFEFFIIMGGFFLLYSLLWKKLDFEKQSSSLFNSKIMIFYILAIIISVLDYLWKGYNFMFFSQILLFSFASIISYQNYKKGKKEHRFLKLYFIVMVLSLAAWVLNFVFASFFGWRLRWLANVYILNIIVFLVFLYGVLKITKRPKN